MPKKTAQPPFRGASNTSAFYDAGLPFAPASVLDNVIPYDTTADRPRIGTRAGLADYFTGGPFGGGAFVQGMGVVSRGRTQTGYEKGSSTDLIGTNGGAHTQGAITGNIWGADQNLGLERYTYENVTNTGPFSDTGVNSAPNKIVSCIARTPDGTKIIVGETYSDGSGNTVGRVTCRDATTLAVVWSKKLSDAGIDRFVSAIACSADWVFVATNHFLRVYKLSDGSNPSAAGSTHNVYGMNGWSQVAVDVKVNAAGTNLFCLFRGSTIGATLPNGPVVTAGIYAEHFRAGVMKFAISTPAQLPTTAEVLTQVVWSPQLGNSDTYYEGTPSPGLSRHGYLRFSEQMPWKPRGLLPVALALLPSGGIVVAHANAAWGPNGTIGNPAYFPPDGTAGYWNLKAFSPDGVYLWRADCDSIKFEDGGAGFFNDLLDPTSKSIAVNPTSGNVYLAGRRTLTVGTAGGFCAWGFSALGDFLWSSDLGGTMRTLAVLPGSTSVVCAGDRNSDYTGAGADYAQLFVLSPVDGTIQKTLADMGSIGVKQAITLDGDHTEFVTDFL